MSKEFILPDPGEGIREARVQEVRVSEGDTVKNGDILLVVETDKANFDVPANFEGTIESLNVKEGDQTRVGEAVLTYSEAGSGGEEEKKEEESDSSDGSDSSDEEEGKKSSAEPKPSDESDSSDTSDTSDSPAERQKSEATSETEGDAPEAPVPASPSTRRLAKEEGVDLRALEGTGEDGRVTEEDVRQAAEGETPEKEEPEEKKTSAEEPDAARWGPIENIELSGIRRTTGKRMLKAWRSIPHVMHADRVDITELEDFRRGHTRDSEQDAHLTLSVFLLQALAAALKEHPHFNAELDSDGGHLILKNYIHIGVAVDTEDGLLVPVIRDVDCKSTKELAEELRQVGETARSGQLKPEDMQGGCCTLTNVGPLGGEGFTPIINSPQVAIVGAGEAKLERVVMGDLEDPKEEIRRMLPLCVSFDHRANDGADAARFVRSMKHILENLETLILET